MLFVNAMADPLYFNLWFSKFRGRGHVASRAFGHASVPILNSAPRRYRHRSAPSFVERSHHFRKAFQSRVDPAAAVLIASDLLHEDYAYVFEAHWDLWTLEQASKDWTLQPESVRFIVRGVEFDDGAFEHEGHIQVDFGSDSPFLQDQVALTSAAEAKVRANVQKLVEFTTRVEKSSGTSARLLWSESDENFAQKLVARLQKLAINCTRTCYDCSSVLDFISLLSAQFAIASPLRSKCPSGAAFGGFECIAF